ncbi:unnamed protein product [Colias eurytheme]|nr:unnamed protein product [Colias eurytheme]
MMFALLPCRDRTRPWHWSGCVFRLARTQFIHPAGECGRSAGDGTEYRLQKSEQTAGDRGNDGSDREPSYTYQLHGAIGALRRLRLAMY